MRDKQKPYLYPKLVSILNFIKSKERSVEGCTKLALLSLFHSVENALRDLNEIYNLGKNYEEMISRAIQSLKSCTCSLKMNCVLNALLALNRLYLVQANEEDSEELRIIREAAKTLSLRHTAQIHDIIMKIRSHSDGDLHLFLAVTLLRAQACTKYVFPMYAFEAYAKDCELSDHRKTTPVEIVAFDDPYTTLTGLDCLTRLLKPELGVVNKLTRNFKEAATLLIANGFGVEALRAGLQAVLNAISAKNKLNIDNWRDKFVLSDCLTTRELRQLEDELIPTWNNLMSDNHDNLESIANLFEKHMPK